MTENSGRGSDAEDSWFTPSEDRFRKQAEYEDPLEGKQEQETVFPDSGGYAGLSSSRPALADPYPEALGGPPAAPATPPAPPNPLSYPGASAAAYQPLSRFDDLEEEPRWPESREEEKPEAAPAPEWEEREEQAVADEPRWVDVPEPGTLTGSHPMVGADPAPAPEGPASEERETSWHDVPLPGTAEEGRGSGTWDTGASSWDDTRDPGGTGGRQDTWAPAEEAAPAGREPWGDGYGDELSAPPASGNTWAFERDDPRLPEVVREAERRRREEREEAASGPDTGELSAAVPTSDDPLAAIADMQSRARAMEEDDPLGHEGSYADRDLASGGDGFRGGHRGSHRADHGNAYGEPYGGQDSYRDRGAYGDGDTYGGQDSYEEPDAYGDRGAYGGQESYEERDTYGEPYGEQDGYGDRGAHGDPYGAGVRGGLHEEDDPLGGEPRDPYGAYTGNGLHGNEDGGSGRVSPASTAPGFADGDDEDPGEAQGAEESEYDDGFTPADYGMPVQPRKRRRDRITEDFPGFEDRPPGGELGDAYPGYDSIEGLADTERGALVTMWLGVASLIPVIGAVTALVALLVTGPKAKKAIRESRGELDGHGLIAIGTGLSGLGIAVTVISVALWLIL